MPFLDVVNFDFENRLDGIDILAVHNQLESFTQELIRLGLKYCFEREHAVTT